MQSAAWLWKNQDEMADLEDREVAPEPICGRAWNAGRTRARRSRGVIVPSSKMLDDFSSLKCISQPTLEILKELKFVKPTAVQKATIPLFLGHKDVSVDACTGSGKTLAFVVPVIEMLHRLEQRLLKNQVPGTTCYAKVSF